MFKQTTMQKRTHKKKKNDSPGQSQPRECCLLGPRSEATPHSPTVEELDALRARLSQEESTSKEMQEGTNGDGLCKGIMKMLMWRGLTLSLSLEWVSFLFCFLSHHDFEPISPLWRPLVCFRFLALPLSAQVWKPPPPVPMRPPRRFMIPRTGPSAWKRPCWTSKPSGSRRRQWCRSAETKEVEITSCFNTNGF